MWRMWRCQGSPDQQQRSWDRTASVTAVVTAVWVLIYRDTWSGHVTGTKYLNMAEKTPGFPKSSLCLSGRCVHHHHYPPANRPDEQNRLFGRLERQQDKNTPTVNQQRSTQLLSHKHSASRHPRGQRATQSCFSCFRGFHWSFWNAVQRAEASPHSSSVPLFTIPSICFFLGFLLSRYVQSASVLQLVDHSQRVFPNRVCCGLSWSWLTERSDLEGSVRQPLQS